MQKIARLATKPAGGPKVGAKLMRPAGRHPHLKMPGTRLQKGPGMPNSTDLTMDSLLGMMGGPKGMPSGAPKLG